MRWCLYLLLAMAACGDDSPPARVDAGAADARTIDPAPYYMDCATAPEACPAPYECARVEHDDGPPTDAGFRDVCLVPCASNAECGPGCCCKAFGCGSSVGADGYCAC